MKLQSLYDTPGALYGASGPFSNILKKLQDANITGKSGKGQGITQLHSSGGGNQNNPAITNPRHREFFNTPKDGGSAESKTARKDGEALAKDDGGWERWTDRYNMKLINLDINA